MELNDDSHLCIRCNQTIIGLQNYVNHRQNSCRTQAKSSPNFGFLDAHTNKKIESYEFNFGDVRDEELNGSDEEDDVEISEQNNKSTESEFKEYDYDFFSSLELQYMSKREGPQAGGGKSFNQPILTRKKTAAIIAQQCDEWIDDSSPSITKKEDYKFFNHNESNESSDTDDSEPVIPRNYTRGKWKPGTQLSSNNFVRKTPNWDENESLSSNDGNYDKSLEVDNTNPPHNHTKGKWIPMGTKIARLEFEDDRIDSKKSERDSFWWCRYCSRNLATRAVYERHLKSNLHKKRTKQQNELEDAGESLPLGNLNELSTHFKNEETLEKKEATLAENIEIIEIESEILDRATTSTPITRTHVDDNGRSINSSCELKASEREVGDTNGKAKRKKFRSRTKITCEECDIKLPVFLVGNHLISHFHYRKMLNNPKKSFDTVLNNFHKIVHTMPFQCQPCKFYFNIKEEFMRHWNSIEHTSTVSKLVAGKFLCSFCKFECVSNGEMTKHLNSFEHQQVVTLINRSKPIIIRYITRLSCKHCHKEFQYNIQLMRHLKSCEFETLDKYKFEDNVLCDVCEKPFQSALSLQKHKIKAHKIAIYYCSECQLTFKTGEEAKAHRRTNQHKILAKRKLIPKNSRTREQMRKVCPVCQEEKIDLIELKQHILSKHPERKFSCGQCGLKFTIPQELSRHVRDKLCKFYNVSKTEKSAMCTITSSTRKVVDTESAETSTQSSEKTFPLITSDSIKYSSMGNDKVPSQGLELIENNFMDILSSSAFQMSSGNEKEENEYGSMIGEFSSSEISFSCTICSFRTSSQAEQIFHEILHQVPIEQKSNVKLQCSICKKFFRKQSLREHLRQHTNERIFDCPVPTCLMSFTRQANLKNHVKNIHEKHAEKFATLTCRGCRKAFSNKSNLDQHTLKCQKYHQTDHVEEIFSCNQQNCDYRGETVEQLKSHLEKHKSTEFKYRCEHCDYKTKISNHLTRHKRIHEAEEGKIYKCNYCDYTCNNSENLRKHILKSSKHQGRSMYECKYCEDETNRFKCNYLKEYHKHLQTVHNATKSE